jgi:hypothetical protein
MEFAPLRELLPADLQAVVDELLVQKAYSDEKTVVPRPAGLAAFLVAEYAAGQAAREALPVAKTTGLPEALNAVLHEWIGA